jgi:hypothetical protein
MINILSFGQTSLETINCDCHHHKVYECVPRYKSNDTLIYVTPYFISNDITSKMYCEYHYKKTDIENIPDSIKETLLDTKEILLNAEQTCAIKDAVSILHISETFKYGYIDSFSWSLNSVNGINFEIAYVNTNPKTIKYIDIYFIVKNSVDDICRIKYNNGSNICHLKCVGPLEQFDYGSWSWDAAETKYYTTGDAHYLHLTKFVITYMDGTKYTLVKELAFKTSYSD